MVTRVWEREQLAPTWSEGSMLAVRVVIGLAVAALAAVGAFALMFVGVVVTTDCFISCGDDPSPILGSLLLTAAALVGGAAVAAAWFAVADRGWPVAWRVIGGLAAVSAVGLIVAVLVT